jgi:hypothetical protein
MSFKKYIDIERDAIEKFGVQKCTQMLASINRLLGVGHNINNFRSNLSIDQFLNSLLSKIKNEDILSEYLIGKFRQEIRNHKIKQII